MTRLSDTQLVILGAAAQRADLSVLPLPEMLKLKGGALTKVMDSLRNKGLIRVIETDGRPQRVVITSGGMTAIGVEREDEDRAPAAGTEATTGATPAEAGVQAADAPTPASKANGAATKAKKGKPVKDKARATKAAPAEKPTPRAGTKQALMIDLLKRPERATVEHIAEATGWQHHTIRGAISGALQKKLGLTVEATRTREVGPNKTDAKGSSTVYRIGATGATGATARFAPQRARKSSNSAAYSGSSCDGAVRTSGATGATPGSHSSQPKKPGIPRLSEAWVRT